MIPTKKWQCSTNYFELWGGLFECPSTIFFHPSVLDPKVLSVCHLHVADVFLFIYPKHKTVLLLWLMTCKSWCRFSIFYDRGGISQSFFSIRQCPEGYVLLLSLQFLNISRLESSRKYRFTFPANIILNKAKNRSKGFGYVTFAKEEEACKAQIDMNGKARIY